MNTFNSLKTLESVTKLTNRFKKGETAYIENPNPEENGNYLYDGEHWNKIKADLSSKGLTTTVYDLNQQIISQMPELAEEKIADLNYEINTFNATCHNTYYMLLCKEYSYFTLFVDEKKNRMMTDYKTLGSGVIDTLKALGAIKSYEVINDSEIEFWVDIKDEDLYCFHLFGYDRGVITYGI